MYEIDYDLLAKQTLSLCEGGDGSPAFETACLANVSALLFDALADVNWAGFYRLMPDGSLLLGPFQGKPACMVLAAGKGVCQAAVSSGRSVYSSFQFSRSSDEKIRQSSMVKIG